MDNRPIGVFDSGVGGLTVARELMRLLPGEDIVYFGDVGRVPYGNRSRETIRRYAAEDMRFLRSRGVKLIVVACGTASSVITEEMTAALGVPYTGVIEPTARAAAAATKNGKVGVIGTVATVKSGSFVRALAEVDSGIQTVCAPCPLFVPLVENGYIEADNPVTTLVAQDYLAPLAEAGVDTLILGCTHFPLLYDLIDRVLGHRVRLIDSGAETARYVQGYLRENGLLADRSTGGKASYFISEQTDTFAATAQKFIGGNTPITAEFVSVEGL